ncbi:MAG: hypothetical protein JW982_01820 [Spirochaetes bacterium]|nr:hypothetical protein [Spirochaetota bacterium]
MKKIFAVITILLTVTAVSSAADAVPAEVKAVTDKILKATADYSTAVAKAKKAKDVAAAINRYADEMEKLAPQIKALDEKYSYLSDQSEESEDESDAEMNETIEEYEQFQEEMQSRFSGDEYMQSMMKIQQYYSDPEVQKALLRLNNIMEEMGVSEEDEFEEDINDDEF